VPANFRILFMQGGGLGENAIVPMNLSRGGLVDVVVTGLEPEVAERSRQVRRCPRRRQQRGRRPPQPARRAGWQLRDGAAYLHICSNETIHGVEYPELPDLAALGSTAPLVVDASSHILSRPIDWSRVVRCSRARRRTSARPA
jgi:phosphoserine aminotransferase